MVLMMMVAIQRVILGLDDNYRTGDSWRFVSADYAVAPDNWMVTFPEVYNANDLAANVLDADFVAIEMGNVVDGQGRTSLNLETPDIKLEVGQTHTVVLDGSALTGLQTTLAVGSDLQLLNVELSSAGGLNKNYLNSGLVGIVLRESGSIILTVRAVNDVLLSEALTLTDDVVYQEGVSPAGSPVQLGLAFTTYSAPAASQNALYQNVPNPVTNQTTIAFDLAEAGEATLTVRDITGRLVTRRTIDAVAGANAVTLQRTELGAAGVLTYTLRSGDFSATRQLVVVR